jgi:hypothetical protein
MAAAGPPFAVLGPGCLLLEVRVSPTGSERQAIIASQVADAAGEDGLVLLYDLGRGCYRAVDVSEAIRLCLAGRASLADWPESEDQFYLTFRRENRCTGGRGIEGGPEDKRVHRCRGGSSGR